MSLKTSPGTNPLNLEVWLELFFVCVLFIIIYFLIRTNLRLKSEALVVSSTPPLLSNDCTQQNLSNKASAETEHSLFGGQRERETMKTKKTTREYSSKEYQKHAFHLRMIWETSSTTEKLLNIAPQTLKHILSVSKK